MKERKLPLLFRILNFILKPIDNYRRDVVVATYEDVLDEIDEALASNVNQNGGGSAVTSPEELEMWNNKGGNGPVQ